MATQENEWISLYGVQYNNTRPNFKTEIIDEQIYGTNDVIDLEDTKLNFSYYDNQTVPPFSNFTTDDYCSSNHSHVYLNVTCEFPINYAEPMYGYIAPFLLATTTVANTLIVVVLSRRHMRTPTNVVLMAMALCDMFTMLFPAPWLFYMYTFGNHYKPLSPIRACQAWNYMNEFSGIPYKYLTLKISRQSAVELCNLQSSYKMSRVRTNVSFVDLLCLLPNEWKVHPQGVIRMILTSEIQDHLQNNNTTEGLVITIDGVTAVSVNHCHAVWFRKQDEKEVEPDLMNYYGFKIRVHEAVEMSRI